jgi:hypothetical protein
MFEAHGLPVLSHYARIAHEHGRRFTIHACGYAGDISVAETQRGLKGEIWVGLIRIWRD